jgi:hypothetical protein
VFVIDLASRRVQILGSTPHPEALFMQQIVRTLTMADGGAGHTPHVLICDRDRNWSADVRRRLQDAGIRVVRIPERAPNANACAERVVRSIKEECLDRLIPIGERYFRRAVREYVEHYYGERNHQGPTIASYRVRVVRSNCTNENGVSSKNSSGTVVNPQLRESRSERCTGTSLRPCCPPS